MRNIRYRLRPGKTKKTLQKTIVEPEDKLEREGHEGKPLKARAAAENEPRVIVSLCQLLYGLSSANTTLLHFNTA